MQKDECLSMTSLTNSAYSTYDGTVVIVDTIRVGLQIALIIGQEFDRAVALAAGSVVVDGIRVVAVVTVDPESSGASVPQCWIERRDWRIVGVDYVRAADPLDHQRIKRLEQVGRAQRAVRDQEPQLRAGQLRVRRQRRHDPEVLWPVQGRQDRRAGVLQGDHAVEDGQVAAK